jgi:ParB family protein of integrating conjugative element (PFGI_1 class)
LCYINKLYVFRALFIDTKWRIKQNWQYSVLFHHLGYEMTTHQLTSILSSQGSRISCFEIEVFSLNQRRSMNPLYGEIKESILKKGVQNPLHIVFHPIQKKWVLSQGGQTRLLISRELYEETQDEMFLFPPVIQKPYTSDLELCINHLIENHLRGENTFLETAYAVMNIRNLMAQTSGEVPTQDALAVEMSLKGMPIRRQSITAIFYASEVLAPNITNSTFLEELSRKTIDSIRAIRKSLEPHIEPRFFDNELIDLINAGNNRVTIQDIKSYFTTKYLKSSQTSSEKPPKAVHHFSSKFGLSGHLIASASLPSGFLVSIPDRFDSKEQVNAYLLLLGISGVLESNVHASVLSEMGFDQLCDGCDPADLANEIIRRLNLTSSEVLTFSTRLLGLGDDKTFESCIDLVVGMRDRLQNQTTTLTEAK